MLMQRTPSAQAMGQTSDAASSAIAEDPAFGDERLYAYRLRGTTATLGGTLSFALNDHASVDLRYRYASTRSPQSLEYRTSNVALLLAYRL